MDKLEQTLSASLAKDAVYTPGLRSFDRRPAAEPAVAAAR